MWNPERPNVCDTTISYSQQCAQKKRCQVIIRVYDLYGNKIYEEKQGKICPSTYPWTWNGKSFPHPGGIAQ